MVSIGMSIHTSSLTNPRFATANGMHTLVRRLVWNVIPVVMVFGAVQMALLGDDGLLQRHRAMRDATLPEKAGHRAMLSAFPVVSAFGMVGHANHRSSSPAAIS